MISAHLEGYEPSAPIHVSRGAKFRTVIAKLFPQTKQCGIEASLRKECLNIRDDKQADPSKPSAFSTQQKLQNAVGQSTSKHSQNTSPADIKAWLLKHDAYTLHRPVRKRFPRNPYTVNNINDVWECDLVDVQGLSKYNDGVKYLLTAVDVFSKFLHVIPLISKTGKAVTTAFQSIL